ncbi:hypothetical protein [Amycolatopsis pithecellobii]|uniref:Uncharacterized protein n=1 Tax=Amycolatopsis pithecellobii TaxID=664692 RepID=A0A6N7YPF1_9PSEU|nr:hypothetical protein [Amycolatopsis pithecellobii]MTD53758.1 hypothetical protein [Amycolatopsis pithecellobii]
MTEVALQPVFRGEPDVGDDSLRRADLNPEVITPYRKPGRARIFLRGRRI